jgi:hypothetical protein
MKDFIVLDGVTYDINELLTAFLRKPIAKTHIKYSMENGDVYASSIRMADVADDGTLKILLSNPADSTKNICWSALIVASEGKAYLDMYGQITVDTPGTALAQVQKLSGSSRTSVADTEYNGTYTYSAPHLIYQALIPGGAGPHAIGGQAADAELAMAIPGRNVLIVMTNKGGATKDMSMRIIWIDCETVGI